MISLRGKVAVVTGGSRGIGFAIVKTFLESGARVALCASRQETADKAVQELKAIDPGWPVMALTPDLSDREAVESAFEAARRELGDIGILVNNAGVSSSTRLEEYTDEELRRVLDLNVFSVLNCSRAVADGMKARGGGVILNTSSMVSVCGQPVGAAYPASKFAVNGITLSMARELGPYGVRVCAVAPGIIRTDMMRSVPAGTIERLARTIPLQRIGDPQDVANAFLFLASDMASYITGVTLSVDGMCRS